VSWTSTSLEQSIVRIALIQEDTATKMGIPFRCGTVEDNSRWCFQGGVCINQTLDELAIFGERCQCPLGFVNDFISGHFYNCSLPDTLVLSLFIVSSIFTFTAILLVLKQLNHTKSKVKQLASLYTMVVLLDWFIILGFYVENGRGYCSIVSSLFRDIAATSFAVELILVFSGTLLCLLRKEASVFRKKAYLSSTGYFMTDVAAHIAMMATAKETNPERFNSVFAFYLFYNALVFAAVGILFAIKVRGIKEMILGILKTEGSDPSNKKTLEVFLARLDGVRHVPIVCTVGASILVAGLFLVIIGSIAFSYIWIILMHTHMCLLSPVFVRFLVLQENPQQNRTTIQAMHTSRVNSKVDVVAASHHAPHGGD
jgi:hypothetical protein